MRRPHRAFVGLGSNLHQPVRQVDRAVAELARVALTRLIAVSHYYRTAPLGCPEPQPDYINAVAELETALEPEQLLIELQGIEARHGRRPAYRNAPRVLDLDLLLFDQRQLCLPQLQVPHPRIAERAFVLAPLLELCPGLVLPGGIDASASLEKIDSQRIERLPTGRTIEPLNQVA